MISSGTLTADRTRYDVTLVATGGDRPRRAPTRVRRGSLTRRRWLAGGGPVVATITVPAVRRRSRGHGDPSGVQVRIQQPHR